MYQVTQSHTCTPRSEFIRFCHRQIVSSSVRCILGSFGSVIIKKSTTKELGSWVVMWLLRSLSLPPLKPENETITLLFQTPPSTWLGIQFRRFLNERELERNILFRDWFISLACYSTRLSLSLSLSLGQRHSARIDWRASLCVCVSVRCGCVHKIKIILSTASMHINYKLIPFAIQYIYRERHANTH